MLLFKETCFNAVFSVLTLKTNIGGRGQECCLNQNFSCYMLSCCTNTLDTVNTKEKAHFYHEVIYNQYGCVDEEDEDSGKKNV